MCVLATQIERFKKFTVQVVANNDSVLSKVAFQKWPLHDTSDDKSELTNLLKTITRQQESQNQMKLKCKGCKLDSAFCNCSLSEIMFENTFQVNPIYYK